MDRTLLRSGLIVDGLGGPAFPGHVLLRCDRIESVLREGDATPEVARQIDATGCVIAPGFIDMHSHADWQLPLDDHPELLSSMLEQGVTTVVGGNCGISPAPLRRETLGRLHDFASIARDRPFDYAWESFAEYLEQMGNGRPALNLAELVGHSTLRYAGSNTARGPMPGDELSSCLDHLRRSLEEGACGLSFGLGYDPGMYSPVEELQAFCQVAAEAGATATVHLKAYSRISPCYPLTTPEAHNVRALREPRRSGRRPLRQRLAGRADPAPRHRSPSREGQAPEPLLRPRLPRRRRPRGGRLRRSHGARPSGRADLPLSPCRRSPSASPRCPSARR